MRIVVFLLACCQLLAFTNGVAVAQESNVDDPLPKPPNGTEEPELLPGEGGEYYRVMPHGGTEGYAPRPDLFYNYYAQPTGGGRPAVLYMAPRPVPPTVGHTYYTYQPLYPHEYMYPHYREYWRAYGNYHQYGPCHGTQSVNKTTVRYQRGAIRSLYYQPLSDLTIPMIPCGNVGGGLGGLSCRIRGRVGCIHHGCRSGSCRSGNCGCVSGSGSCGATKDCDRVPTPPASQPSLDIETELSTPVGYQRYYAQ